MNRLAVLGHPVAHSLSPAMHSAAFSALEMADDWSYEAVDLSPEAFAAGVNELRERGFVGANVTVPHKEAAFAIADRRSDAVIEIGAANTLSFDEGGIRADNTDSSGLIAALPAGFEPAGMRALVLGAGGSARACGWALARAGVAVSVTNRTEAKATRLAADLGVMALTGTAGLDPGGMLDLQGFDLLVNATSVGLAREGAEVGESGDDLKALRLRADQLIDPLVVVDLVYGSQATELAAMCMSGGATIVDGLEILVRQGADAFCIWTGREPPIEIMRKTVREQHR